MKALKSLAGRGSTFRELLRFLWRERLWWMIPLVVTLLLFCGLILLATQSPVTPFIYTLF